MTNTQFRRYTNRNGEYELLSWRQRRCEKCQRFLSKYQNKYCEKCAKEVEREEQREYQRKRYQKLKNLATHRLS